MNRPRVLLPCVCLLLLGVSGTWAAPNGTTTTLAPLATAPAESSNDSTLLAAAAAGDSNLTSDLPWTVPLAPSPPSTAWPPSSSSSSSSALTHAPPTPPPSTPPDGPSNSSSSSSSISSSPAPAATEAFSYEILRHRCPAELRDGIWWNETCGGVIAARRCPQEYAGSAFRMCFYGGDWGQVDGSECRLASLIRLKHVVYYHVHKNLTRGLHSLADDLLHLLRNFRLHSLDDVLEALDIMVILLDSRPCLDLVQPSDSHYVQTLLEIGDRLFTREEIGWAPPHNQQDQVTLKMVQVLHTMGSLSTMVADGMKRAGYTAFKVDALQHTGLVAQVTDAQRDYVFSRRRGNHSDAGDRIVVPAAVHPFSGSAGAKYVFVTLWYRGFHHRLEDPDMLVISDLLSMSVHPGRSYRVSAPVTVTFRSRQIWDPEAFHVECSFLQKTSNRSNLWSNGGCVVVGVKEHEVSCQCHHVNNVAVILRRIIRPPIKVRPDAVNIVVLIGCCVALASLLTTFVAHAHLIRPDAAESTLILFNLVFAMATTQIVFMAGIQATDRQAVCEGVSIVLHYLHLVTSFWLLAHGIHVYLRLRRGPDGPALARHMRDYCLLAWVVPVILVVITFIVNPRGYETRRYCWLSIERGMLLSFIVPISALIMINTTLMVLALKHFFELRAVTRKTDINRIRIAMRLGVVVLPLFGVNWFVGVLALEDTSTYVFEAAFAFTNSLQGFLIFFFNCVLNTEIRHGLCRRCCFFRRKQRKSLDLRLRRSRKRQREIDAKPLLIKVDEGPPHVTGVPAPPPLPASVAANAAAATAAAAAANVSASAQPPVAVVAADPTAALEGSP